MHDNDVNLSVRRGTNLLISPDTSTKPIMLKRPLYFLPILLLAGSIGVAALAAPPPTPIGVCIEHSEGVQCAASTNTSTIKVTSSKSGVFPGTNLKFYPGFIIGGTGENASLTSIQSRWDAIFTSSPNRKESYRPPGVYGAVARRLAWSRFYTNQSVRPTNPANHTDAGYDWSLLDSTFTIAAVQNDRALVFIDLQEAEAPNALPTWLINAPYNGTFVDSNNSRTPRYDRYAGPDKDGNRNVGVGTGKPPIVEEWVAFHRAMHDHLVATGNINKVMGVSGGELVVNTVDSAALPTDFNVINFLKGAGLRNHLAAQIWAESGITTYALTILSGNKKTYMWPYMDDPTVGLSFPDMKMTSASISGILGNSRFDDLYGVYQKDIRPLQQRTEGNGMRESTFFEAGSRNPWGYSNQSVGQTPMHVLWALSGAPKATDPAKRDSGLGQAGEDHSGFMPVHQVFIGFQPNTNPDYPTAEEWQQAIDTFGPPGTFAFPYLPPGYEP